MALVYLFLRVFELDWAQMGEYLFRERTGQLVLNTILLIGSVLAVTTLLAVPYAWLTSRTDLRGKWLFALLGTLPLAIPAYVMATALLSLGGDYGLGKQLLGWEFARPRGFWGATLVLSLYTFPYLFLNLRTAMMRLDAGQEEAARTLGLGRFGMLRRVVLPQLRPAYLAGALLVVLHVLADFGAVSLLGFDTLSRAVYDNQFDEPYAACLALILVFVATALLCVDAWLLRGRRAQSMPDRAPRTGKPVRLGGFAPLAYVFVSLVPLVGLALPCSALVYWVQQGDERPDTDEFLSALSNSAFLAALAAVLAVAVVVPLLYRSVRGRTRAARIFERLPYVAYAIPPVAFALSLVFVSRSEVGMRYLYQTFGLLLFALTVRFLAEAVGPLRTALYRLPPRLEEVARTLGCTAFGTFRRVVFPLLWRGAVVSMALVFLAVSKELPMTMLLAPLGFETLATNVWSYSSEAQYPAAALHALAIVAMAGILFSLLYRKEARWR